MQQAASAELKSQLLALMRDIAHDAATAAARAVLQAHDLPRLSLQHETAQPEPTPPPPAAPVQPEPVPLPPAAPAQPELVTLPPTAPVQPEPVPPPPAAPAQPEPVPPPPPPPAQPEPPEPEPPPPAALAQPEPVPPPPAAPAHPEPVSAATTSALAVVQHPAIPSVAAIPPAPAPPTRPRSPERTMNRIGAGFLGSVNFVTMCTGLDLAFAINVLRSVARRAVARESEGEDGGDDSDAWLETERQKKENALPDALKPKASWREPLKIAWVDAVDITKKRKKPPKDFTKLQQERWYEGRAAFRKYRNALRSKRAHEKHKKHYDALVDWVYKRPEADNKVGKLKPWKFFTEKFNDPTYQPTNFFVDNDMDVDMDLLDVKPGQRPVAFRKDTNLKGWWQDLKAILNTKHEDYTRSGINADGDNLPKSRFAGGDLKMYALATV
eukprot:jgi/Tetstr1/438477/TSEL_027032.t1